MRRLTALLFLSCLGSLHSQESPLRYSANPLYPPYHWAGSDAFDGASVELLPLVLPPGTAAVPVKVPWLRALSMAENGDVDLLLSLRITPERQAFLEFTTHRAFPNPIAVFVRAGSPIRVDDWSALKPYRGGVSLGDYFGGGFDEYLRTELHMESAPSMVENFEKLRLGRIDYFVTGYYLGQCYLGSRGLADQMVSLKPYISNQDIYFGFSKRSPWVKLLPYVSQRLAELDRKGVLDALLRKHTARFSGLDAPKLFP